ncbi:MAG: CPBP family intramembrane metalloprotease [Candidatus Solibacter usitatus]|nr:CPBP family intramembrane metalloprotease [Candidatus Solibacter usitatus]
MTGPQFLEPQPAPSPDSPFWGWADAALLLLLAGPSLLLSLALSKGLFLLLPTTGAAAQAMATQFLFYGIWFSNLWLILRFRYGRPFWRSMAWIIPWPRMGLTIFIGPSLVLVVVVLGEALRTPIIDNAIQRLLQDRLSIFLVGFFATTLGPLAEELVFRGFLQPLLVERAGAPLGIALASAPFALLHGPQYSWSWQHIVLLFLASAVFGITRWRTGSTAASTLVHATYNLAFYTGFLLQRKDLFQ